MNISYITRFFYTCNHLHSKQPSKIEIINTGARGWVGGRDNKRGGRDRERALPEEIRGNPLKIT